MVTRWSVDCPPPPPPGDSAWSGLHKSRFSPVDDDEHIAVPGLGLLWLSRPDFWPNCSTSNLAPFSLISTATVRYRALASLATHFVAHLHFSR